MWSVLCIERSRLRLSERRQLRGIHPGDRACNEQPVRAQHTVGLVQAQRGPVKVVQDVDRDDGVGVAELFVCLEESRTAPMSVRIFE